MTRKLLPIRTVLEDESWLGSLMGAPSYRVMRTLLIAAMGEALTADELEIFTSVTGRTIAPGKPVEELWVAAGRRSGKSLGVAVASAYLAACCDYRGVLAKGERGILPVMAGSKEQARQVFNFLKGIFTNIPRFAAMLQKTSPRGFGSGSGITTDRITLRNSVDIQIREASHRTIRGVTAIAAIAEEISTWQSDESLNPDSEILAAVRPALATTGGPLFCIGSPRSKRGETYKTYRKHFGPLGHQAILVANGSTKTFNPTLRQSVIDRAYEEDAQVASSEWGGKFRDDLETYISPEKVDECTDFTTTVRPWRPGFHYVSHCDPSGGSQDSFTLSVGHTEGDKAVLDILVEHRPPFSPEAVIADLCNILHSYRINTTCGDKYASGFNSELFTKYGVSYIYAGLTTSDYFGSFVPILNSPNRCRLLDSKRLHTQLCSLERRPSRVGAKDAISHPPGGHDDLAAAVAGLFVRMIGVRDYMPKRWTPPPDLFLPRGAHPGDNLGNGHGVPMECSTDMPGIARGEEYRTADVGVDWITSIAGGTSWRK